jgi:hypothetical protein
MKKLGIAQRTSHRAVQAVSGPPGYVQKRPGETIFDQDYFWCPVARLVTDISNLKRSEPAMPPITPTTIATAGSVASLVTSNEPTFKGTAPSQQKIAKINTSRIVTNCLNNGKLTALF